MERTRRFGLLSLGLAAVLVLGACGGGSADYVPPAGGSGPTLGNDPVVMSPAELRAEAQLLGQPIYWAGPRKGREYEFQRTSIGYVFVRYLPRGLSAGAAGNFLTIGTYPYVGAFKAVKATGNGNATAGPGGSILYVRPDHRGSVLMAFHRVPYEIEVYDPRLATSVAVARSGRVRPVR